MTINKKPCYIKADFNINLLSTDISVSIVNLMSSYYFKPYISTHTSSIDNIFSNANMNPSMVQLVMTFQIIYLFTTVAMKTTITTIILIIIISPLTKLGMKGFQRISQIQT